MQFNNKIILPILATALLSTTAQANTAEEIKKAWKESKGHSKLLTGFSNTSFNIGASFEKRKGTTGLDTMFFTSGDNGSSGVGNKDAQLFLGSSLVYHLVDASPADVYLGTGVNVMVHRDVGEDKEDKTTVGPLFRLGSSYYINNNYSIGLDYINAINWSNDDIASENSYGFLSIGYTY